MTSFVVNTTIAGLNKKMFDREGLEDVMKRRFLVAPSFEIYPNAPAGIYTKC
jgi:hypothetical protein